MTGAPTAAARDVTSGTASAMTKDSSFFKPPRTPVRSPTTLGSVVRMDSTWLTAERAAAGMMVAILQPALSIEPTRSATPARTSGALSRTSVVRLRAPAISPPTLLVSCMPAATADGRLSRTEETWLWRLSRAALGSARMEAWSAAIDARGATILADSWPKSPPPRLSLSSDDPRTLSRAAATPPSTSNAGRSPADAVGTTDTGVTCDKALSSPPKAPPFPPWLVGTAVGAPERMEITELKKSPEVTGGVGRPGMGTVTPLPLSTDATMELRGGRGLPSAGIPSLSGLLLVDVSILAGSPSSSMTLSSGGVSEKGPCSDSHVRLMMDSTRPGCPARVGDEKISRLEPRDMMQRKIRQGRPARARGREKRADGGILGKTLLDPAKSSNQAAW